MPENRKYTEPLLPGQIYHVFNHAVGSENLFRERDNFLFFLKRYTEYISPVCDTFAYCLMPNHFHFLIQVHAVEVLRGHAALLHRLGVPKRNWKMGHL